jgi:hypothetical protein
MYCSPTKCQVRSESICFIHDCTLFHYSGQLICVRMTVKSAVGEHSKLTQANHISGGYYTYQDKPEPVSTKRPAYPAMIYIFVLIFDISTEGFTFQLPPFVQLIGGIVTFLTVPGLVILYTAIRFVNDGD